MMEQKCENGNDIGDCRKSSRRTCSSSGKVISSELEVFGRKTFYDRTKNQTRCRRRRRRPNDSLGKIPKITSSALMKKHARLSK